MAAPSWRPAAATRRREALCGQPAAGPAGGGGVVGVTPGACVAGGVAALHWRLETEMPGLLGHHLLHHHPSLAAH
jgi:hypothetical protein